ncbi:MAG TPA: TIGR04283 family arsenosugar biosynthesis glycosyltransferase [Nitrospiraceae bacterium]|nr:TIGR04283 family arsenosugar biosynthesis glycosyltransferase [Nitrospiraceae bacterium]
MALLMTQDSGLSTQHSALRRLRISVIMPVLNEEQILQKTLSHTLALSFDDVIVVDGSSRDRTRDIVAALQVRGSRPAARGGESLPDLKPRTSNLKPRTQPLQPPTLTLLTTLPGRACQMNAGAAMSEGDVLVFVHADTQLPIDARALIEQALQNPAHVGGRFDVRFEPDTRWGRVIGRMMNWRSRWSGIATGDQAIFVRRECFEQLGGFSDVPIMEDIEFTRRLKRVGRIAAVRSTVVTSYRRWQQGGPLKTIALMWLLRGLYWMGISPHALTRMYAHVR